MIVIRLIGGLGNQMFQYALGRNLAIINNTEFKLDITDLTKTDILNKHTIRDYELNHFQIIENIASVDEINHFNKNNNRLSKLINRFRRYYRRPIVVEKQLSFDANIFKIRENSYLQGYWQSEEYFKEIREILLKEFKLKLYFRGNIQTIANEIINSNSVSLHIRRGDYVNTYSDYYFILDNTYYLNAITYIRNKYTNTKLFVFSDDIEWARKNLKDIENITFVEQNKSYEDMYLMSLCKHNIIANSSFSWWGAWLNENDNRLVVAPKKWFKNESRIHNIIPEKWIAL